MGGGCQQEHKEAFHPAVALTKGLLYAEPGFQILPPPLSFPVLQL